MHPFRLLELENQRPADFILILHYMLGNALRRAEQRTLRLASRFGDAMHPRPEDLARVGIDKKLREGMRLDVFVHLIRHAQFDEFLGREHMDRRRPDFAEILPLG
ncbi:hypothetical protein D3C86_1992810 [compost metagenome]